MDGVTVKVVCGALALAFAACGRRPDASPPGLGHAVASGSARALRASADGTFLAFLDHCARPGDPLVPQEVFSCDLEVVPVAGGSARRVAAGVTSLPFGYAWSAAGADLAALAAYDHASATGTLIAVRAGGSPVEVAEGVSFYAFAPGSGKLAYVAHGQLFAARRDGSLPEPVAGADRIATFETSPGEASAAGALARRAASAGGDLLAITDWRHVERVASRTGDYLFSPDGARFAFTSRQGDRFDLSVASARGDRRRRLGEDVQTFSFSRDGKALAFLGGVKPGRSGELWAAWGGAAPVRLGQRVGEYRFAAAAPRVAWLQDFDPRVRAGSLAAGGPGLVPLVLGKNVTAYELSADGRRIAFLEHVTSGSYSVDLRVAPVEAGAKAATVARGVFGFDFSPDGSSLYYRTACVQNAEACDLYRIPAAGLAPGVAPEKIAAGVKSFEFDRRHPGRLLVGWSRSDLVSIDLALWRGGKLTPIDSAAVAGSAVFLPPDSSRVAYVVADRKRAGVYVAELPR